ncbi:hypothetical protein [Devosia rhizoryzae]|uniref:Uncharacterized protein n=1 Tax=Devosia rhizoryzae TaxID=2774137 RepID=A0ABX7C7M1_9HYPH|nr:hypothetical protein [Devosia rhizoryzae]QQR40223.1 hypothetical protein JI748_04215 [Devosia rhizoryzae]
MRTSLATAVLLFLATAAPALAQCPPAAAGNTADEIRSNERRIVCLQQQLTVESERRQFGIELDMLNQRLRELQLQRQFDVLPAPVVPRF